MSNDREVAALKRAELAFRLYQDLGKETDRTCGLMAAEYCSAKLRDLLTAAFIDDKKAVSKVLGDTPNATLGVFSARIDLAYLMGLISKRAHRELHLVRKIRNQFAHAYVKLSFDDPTIANWCRELDSHNVFERPNGPRKNFLRNVMGLLAMLSRAEGDRQHCEPVEDVNCRDLPTPDERRLVDERSAVLAKYLDDLEASGVSGACMDQYRLEVALELRAFIESLRKKTQAPPTSTDT